MVHVTPVINHEADIFANYAIVVIDARNLMPVTGYVAVRGEMTCARPERVSLGVPACRVEEKLWPDKDASFSPQATGDLRKAFDEMLAASIPETLFHLGLNQDQAGAQ